MGGSFFIIKPSAKGSIGSKNARNWPIPSDS